MTVFDVPFEESDGGQLPVADMRLSGGIVCVAGVLPMPDGVPRPALVFRFTEPGGEFYPGIVLVMEDDAMTKVGLYVAQAAQCAVRKARAQRDAL